MASHVGFQGVAAGMGQAFSAAAHPFASILLLPIFYMGVVYVFDQLVHIPLVARWTTLPVANRDLILEIFLVESRIDGGAWNITRRIR